MSISGLFTTNRQNARLSVKLFLGAWLLSAVPAMALTGSQMPSQTPSQTVSPMLIAQARLSEGSRGPAVTELQRKLDERGLFPGAIDGVYGPTTTQAVRQFQRIRRLDVTGVADPQTLNLLGIDTQRLAVGLTHPNYGTINSEDISAVSSPDDIITLQRVLRSYGFNIGVDGVYGSETMQAVRTYQRTADLPVDGVADRATLVHMGFRSGGRSSSSSGSFGNDGNRSQGRYVAAIIAGRSELGQIRRSFPNATVENNSLGDYISLGRFQDRSDAEILVDDASDLGYDARVLHD
ncbi:peptidoglycan-binding domain-containing protein [Leptothoe sp. PORK10 BA2]|uniref:peptidoglycan-binding domain-containing protein n=1 Tax=Leptothoe sp. PORK10 BA2 TaxID=3110254 RepID=UPI002B20B8A8|nr:peptidoglycan-binding protein [Leptothoe sp. PORK10 BA2]MEA5465387.1 peptidoglycan-binding protein [Leptothoe sp. PORK10 BA2]